MDMSLTFKTPEGAQTQPCKAGGCTDLRFQPGSNTPDSGNKYNNTSVIFVMFRTWYLSSVIYFNRQKWKLGFANTDVANRGLDTVTILHNARNSIPSTCWTGASNTTKLTLSHQCLKL